MYEEEELEVESKSIDEDTLAEWVKKGKELCDIGEFDQAEEWFNRAAAAKYEPAIAKLAGLENERKEFEERRIREAEKSLIADSEIKDNVLIKYNGKGGYLKIPDGVTRIGDDAFKDCKGLTKIDLPNSLKGIGDYAFSHCSGLTGIEIPSGVTSIGDFAFNRCSDLSSIIVSNENKKYHSSCNCLIETEKKKLIKGCNNSVIPSDGSVTSIKCYAFDGCKSLTDIEIPNSVTNIGKCAFYICNGLTSIRIPNGVKSIEQNVFGDCYGLTNVEISNGVTSIGDWAFSFCFSLASIEIPNSVTSIGYRAFCWCNRLTSITIPNSVKSIGKQVFDHSEELNAINFGGTKRDWKKAADKRLFGEKAKHTCVVHCSNGDITIKA